MKDILQDIVAHTHALGVFPQLKFITTDTETRFTSVSEDRSVILSAETNQVVPEFKGTFGMGDLEKLNLHLKNPEYQEDEKIEIVHITKDNETFPAHLHFENFLGDFKNDYRFINEKIIESKIKTFKFKGNISWDLDFEPSIASIARLKLMSAAHAEETTFNVRTDSNNLIFSFGDANTHAGEYVFKSNVTGNLNAARSYPISAVSSILSLSGDKRMQLSSQGAMKIDVNSGLINYEYILPAQAK